MPLFGPGPITLFATGCLGYSIDVMFLVGIIIVPKHSWAFFLVLVTCAFLRCFPFCSAPFFFPLMVRDFLPVSITYPISEKGSYFFSWWQSPHSVLPNGLYWLRLRLMGDGYSIYIWTVLLHQQEVKHFYISHIQFDLAVESGETDFGIRTYKYSKDLLYVTDVLIPPQYYYWT